MKPPTDLDDSRSNFFRGSFPGRHNSKNIFCARVVVSVRAAAAQRARAHLSEESGLLPPVEDRCRQLTRAPACAQPMPT